VRLEGLGQLKNLTASSRLDPTTFRLVGYRLAPVNMQIKEKENQHYNPFPHYVELNILVQN
jgi:hypothetical protein